MCSPPLIQDMAIVWVTLFNLFCFWGPKNTGPNPDHPEIISKASPSAPAPWDPYSGRLISIFWGPLVKGGGERGEGGGGAGGEGGGP